MLDTQKALSTNSNGSFDNTVNCDSYTRNTVIMKYVDKAVVAYFNILL